MFSLFRTWPVTTGFTLIFSTIETGIGFGFLVFLRHFQQYFSYIMATSFSGGRCRSTRREPPTNGKQLVNFITCDCESSAPFCNLQSRARTHAVLVIGSYELLGNPTHWATRALIKTGVANWFKRGRKVCTLHDIRHLKELSFDYTGVIVGSSFTYAPSAYHH